MARETIHGTNDENKRLILMSLGSGLANACNCKGVGLEGQGGNAWECKEDMLASRPVDVAVGDGNTNGVVGHMLDDCLDGGRASAVDEEKSDDSKNTIGGPEANGHPNVNTQPMQFGQRFTNGLRRDALWLVEVGAYEVYCNQADVKGQEKLERMGAHWANREQEKGPKSSGTHHPGQVMSFSQLCGRETIFTNGKFIYVASVGNVRGF